MNKKVLIKDIVIPKGTVFTDRSGESSSLGSDWYGTTIGLTTDTYGEFIYSFDADQELLEEYFVDLKE